MPLDEQGKKIEELKEKIAGEIVFAPDVSGAFKKWRNIFDLGQKKLAIEMNLKVSTVSDYENGRRKNPGLFFIKRYVDTLCRVDSERNGEVVKSLIGESTQKPFDIREFKKIIRPEKLFSTINLFDVNSKKLEDHLFGVTYVDTLGLKDFDLSKYPLVFGKTNKRLVFFTKTSDLHIIEYTLKLLKHFTGQQPSAVIIEEATPEQSADKYKALSINVPLFLTNKTKEEVNELLKF